MHELITAASEIQPTVVELRRALHRHPEVGNDLPVTRGIVLDALDGLPLELTLHESTSGIAAVLRGGAPGPTILLRGDMDGLPMPEDTGLPFASEQENRMHACGHDLHTAMLAGSAMLLSSRRDELAGNVVFMFQPGEEGYFGAKFMLDEGLLDTSGAKPTGAFAIHVTAMTPSGTFTHRPGPQMASADDFTITVTGKGGHASRPFAGLDPIPVAAEIILAVETAITRRINVFDPGVITFGNLHAGTTHNVIPETAEMGGTIRAFSAETRDELHAILDRVSRSVAQAHKLDAALTINPGYPVSVNDEAFAAFVTDVATDLVGADKVIAMPTPIMGAEDWSYVMNEVPGTMTFLGACPPDQVPGVAPNNHSNRVEFHEHAMEAGVAMYAAVAMRHLAGG